MSNVFEYRCVDENLIQEVADYARRGESSVFLSPPCGGKRFAIRALSKRLRLAEGSPVVEVKFVGDLFILSVQDLEQIVCKALRRAMGANAPESTGDLYRLFDAANRKVGRKIFVITRNVDAVSHGLARQYLQTIRTLVQERKIVAVMSGEFDLRELVHGPNSEFDCHHQYVLQGLGEAEFSEQMRLYGRELGIRFHPDAVRDLHVLAGGNAYIMRLVLWAVIESGVRKSQSAHEPIEKEELRRLVERSAVLHAHRAQLLRPAIRLIPMQASCWSNLEKLIRGEPVELREPSGPPGALTLSGIAHRKDRDLTFSSALVAEQVRAFFQPRRLADLHARAGEWKEAVRRYSVLDPALAVRPSDSEDRAEAEAVVNALAATMSAQAGMGSDHLKVLLDQGCRLILGFPEVLFWQEETGWLTADASRPSDAGAKAGAVLQQMFGGKQRGVLESQESWSQFAIVAVLPAVRRDRGAGAMLGDFQRKGSISRERARLAKRLLQQFLAAYEHAIEAERSSVRLEVRTRHNEIIGSILAALGSAVRDVRDVLSRAASGLRKLGYRRVLFCLVDPKGERIEGELEQSDDTSVDVAKMTSYALDDPEKDIQPYVIRTREPRLVEDATNDRLVNQQVVVAARLKAFVVVPVLNLRREAIGTIHVERADMAVPSAEEVEDLIAFGRQVAVAIEQSERVNLLQSTLDGSNDPVIIVDALKRLRYANRPASDLLSLQPGWLDRGPTPPLTGERTEGVAECIEEAFKAPHICPIHGVGSQPEYRGEAFSDKICDWRSRTAGVFVHIKDQNELFQMFAALRLIASAKNYSAAMDTMLEATKLLGHGWGRLYLTDPADPDILVGRRCFGFKDADMAAKFTSGKIKLPPRESNPDSWRSIDEGGPVVFRQAKEGEPLGRVLTRHGLEVWYTDHKYEEPLSKEPGDYWLDFPLIMHGTTRAKITLQCDDELRPQRVELLRVLSSLAAGLLDAIWARDDAYAQKELWIQQAADKSMSITAHNIATRFVGLGVLLARYQRRETECPSLVALNAEFREAYAHILSELNHIKKMLQGTAFHPEPMDLRSFLATFLQQKLNFNQFTIDPSVPLVVDADPRLLSGAFSELIQNSFDASRRPEEMRISLAVSLVSGEDTSTQVQIKYCDNGPGVPEEIKEKIFQDFFTERPGKPAGVGLGLTYVLRAVQAHGGEIKEDGPDEQFASGARFIIKFPLRAQCLMQEKEAPGVSHSDC